MNQGSRIIGSHVSVFRNGGAFTVPAAGTAGPNSKPGATDPAWIDLGIITDLGVNPVSEVREIFAPTPGVLRRVDVLETKCAHDAKITIDEMSPFAFELLFWTLALTTGSTNYNPNAQPGKKVWLKIQQYDGQTDALFNTLDLFCFLKVSGEVKFADQSVTVPLDVKVLHSIYNQGTLA